MKHLVLYGRNVIEALAVKTGRFMAALANGIRVTYIDPAATFTACKATRYWQVRPDTYALNLAIIHEVLEQEAYDKDFVRATLRTWTSCRRGGQGHDAGMAGAPHRRHRRAVRAFVKEIAASAT